MYSILAETEDFTIKTCELSNATILYRKVDNAYCFIDDRDTNLLVECVDNSHAFKELADSFTLLDALQEKAYVKDTQGNI